jgi:hypothetical protein
LQNSKVILASELTTYDILNTTVLVFVESSVKVVEQILCSKDIKEILEDISNDVVFEEGVNIKDEN